MNIKNPITIQFENTSSYEILSFLDTFLNSYTNYVMIRKRSKIVISEFSPENTCVLRERKEFDNIKNFGEIEIGHVCLREILSPEKNTIEVEVNFEIPLPKGYVGTLFLYDFARELCSRYPPKNTIAFPDYYIEYFDEISLEDFREEYKVEKFDWGSDDSSSDNKIPLQKEQISEKKFEDIPDEYNYRKIAKYWNEGLTLKKIATLVFLQENTVRNIVYILRRDHGEKLIPKHKDLVARNIKKSGHNPSS